MNADLAETVLDSHFERVAWLDSTGLEESLGEFIKRKEGNPLAGWSLQDIAHWLTVGARHGVRWLWLQHWECTDDTWLALSLDKRLNLFTDDCGWTRIEWKGK
jgi:hypothetical protein